MKSNDLEQYPIGEAGQKHDSHLLGRKARPELPADKCIAEGSESRQARAHGAGDSSQERGWAIGHPDIQPERSKLYRADGLHLSNECLFMVKFV